MQTTSQTATAIANPNLASRSRHGVNPITLTEWVVLEGIKSLGEQISVAKVNQLKTTTSEKNWGCFHEVRS